MREHTLNVVVTYSTVFIIIITSVATVSPEGRRAIYALG